MTLKSVRQNWKQIAAVSGPNLDNSIRCFLYYKVLQVALLFAIQSQDLLVFTVCFQVAQNIGGCPKILLSPQSRTSIYADSPANATRVRAMMAWCGRTHIPAESVSYTLPACPLSKRTHQTSSTFRMIQNISQRNFWHSSRVIAQSPASEILKWKDLATGVNRIEFQSPWRPNSPLRSP